jgi:hypothetical protein
MNEAKWVNMKTPAEKLLEIVEPSDGELLDAIEAVPMVKAKRIAAIERGQRAAEAARERAVLIQKQIAIKKQKEAELKAERERSAREIVNAHSAEIEADIARQKQDAAADKERKADREKKRKAAAKQWKRDAPLREQMKQADALQERKDKAAKEMAHRKHVSAVVDRIGMVFRDDALYANLKALRITLTVPTERKRLKEALLDASVRFREEAGKW